MENTIEQVLFSNTQLLYQHPLGWIVELFWIALITFVKILYKREIISKIDDKPTCIIKSLLLLNAKEFQIH